MDEIVTTGQFEGDLYIFTRSGRIYKMSKDQVTGDTKFQLFHDLFPWPGHSAMNRPDDPQDSPNSPS